MGDLTLLYVFFAGLVIGRFFANGPFILIAKDISSGAFSVTKEKGR